MIFPTLDLFCRPSHFRDFLKPLGLPLFSASFVSRRFFSFYQIPFSAKGLAETAMLILKVSYFLQQKLIYLKSIIDVPLIIKSIRKLTQPQKLLFSELTIFDKLLLLAPAVNAFTESSCSIIRKIKTYHFTTMTEIQLNHFIILST